MGWGQIPVVIIVGSSLRLFSILLKIMLMVFYPFRYTMTTINGVYYLSDEVCAKVEHGDREVLANDQGEPKEIIYCSQKTARHRVSLSSTGRYTLLFITNSISKKSSLIGVIIEMS